MQNIDFPFPSSPRRSWDLEAAHERDLQWVTSWGLVDTNQALHRYRKWGIGALAAHAFPEAVGPDLELGANALGWFTLFDDQFDGPVGEQPKEVVNICHDLLGVLNGQHTHLDGPFRALAGALRDLWERSTHGMSDAWCGRFHRSWELTFAGFVQEAEDRVRHAAPDLSSYFHKRVRSLGTYLWCALVERLEECPVPERAWEFPALGELQYLHGELCVMVNDVFSLDRETDLGDVDGNLISLLCQDRSITVPQAVAELMPLAERTIQAINQHQARLPNIGDRLRLSAEERARLTHYATCLAAMSRGNYDWSRQTLRYRAADA
ncbi:hypothetical protein RIF23_02595 [Lipingzhangella sp. LS1_29]|uniref:Terpene synthase n=1 Tax=Lipingzhangella rawalii TaxID=2055835 RepID=A0ABU2H1K2_9ACTN|nr:hypothetical protein [Lipingzhangella rawalii]MDS1269181.1 hypothetical protein [Lipingzhangella rawalii]